MPLHRFAPFYGVSRDTVRGLFIYREKQMTKKQTYWEKLQHPMWQQRRLEIMKKADFKCEQCDSNEKQLNIHHLYYVSGRDPWQYPTWSLKCLCKDCHKDNHEEVYDDDNEFCFMPFEDMFSWLEGDKDDVCNTWDLCAQIDMIRQSNPERLNEFIGLVLHYAYNTRKEMEKEKP